MQRYVRKFREGHDSWERFIPDNLNDTGYKKVMRTIKRLKADPKVIFILIAEDPDDKHKYDNNVFYVIYNQKRNYSSEEYALYSTLFEESNEKYPYGESTGGSIVWAGNNQTIIKYLKSYGLYKQYMDRWKKFKVVKNITTKIEYFTDQQKVLVKDSINEALNKLQRDSNKPYTLNFKTLKLLKDKDYFSERKNLVLKENPAFSYVFREIFDNIDWFNSNVDGVYNKNNKILTEILKIMQ